MKFDSYSLESLVPKILYCENGRVNYITYGAVCNYFALMIEGHASFVSDGGSRVDLYPGELLYIPKGEKYTSFWYGDGGARFFSVGFDFSHFSKNSGIFSGGFCKSA